MTANEVLVELLSRLAAAGGDAVFVGSIELEEWPAEAVTALKSQKLVVKTKHRNSVVCPGCEQECMMLVHSQVTGGGNVALFVVCDKRDDINRVPVSQDLVTQWKCDVGAVCEFVAACLSVRRSEARSDDPNMWLIGTVTGKKRSQMVCLRLARDVELVAGGNAVPLADVIDFGGREYSLNTRIVQQLVDSATTADARYTPSNSKREEGKNATQARYTAWQRAYRALKKSRPNMSDVWYSQQIAKTPAAEGRDENTIKKHMLA